jgi:hypothetical protein
MKAYKDQNILLDSKIIALQNKKKLCYDDLTIQLNYSYAELRPSKLLIRALNDIKEEPRIKYNLYETLISIALGFVSKKIVVGNSKSTFKNLIGFAVQYFMTKFISKNMKTENPERQ